MSTDKVVLTIAIGDDYQKIASYTHPLLERYAYRIGAAVDQLSKESCAPDRETPDWMKADIRRGMIWMKERLTSFKTNQS